MVKLDFDLRFWGFFMFVTKVRKVIYRKKNLERLINRCVNSSMSNCTFYYKCLVNITYRVNKALKSLPLEDDSSLLGQPPLSCTELLKNERTSKPGAGTR